MGVSAIHHRHGRFFRSNFQGQRGIVQIDGPIEVAGPVGLLRFEK